MSIPSNVYDFLLNAVGSDVSSISPFVRPTAEAFPFVVYDFETDDYVASTWNGPGVPLVRFEAVVVSRSMEEAETVAQQIVDALPGEDGCPIRIRSLIRSYEPSYDGQRPGEYLITLNLERFS